MTPTPAEAGQSAVVVVIDALRADRVGTYQGFELTPNLNRIAADGVTFSNAFTPINATDPAVTSLHSGLYPLSHGILNHGMWVTGPEKARGRSVFQFPAHLQKHGVETIHVGRYMGRWHYLGFDVTPKLAARHRFWTTFDRYVGDLRHRNAITEAVFDGLYYYLMKVITRFDRGVAEPVSQLSEAIPARDRFYATVHLMDTHVPYTADEAVVADYWNRFDYAEIDLEDVVGNLGDDPWLLDQRRNLVEGAHEPRTVSKVQAWYDAAVTHADDRLGRIVAELEDRGRYDDTLLIVLADHGESLAEHGIYFDHHGLYDQTIRIPLVVKPPQSAPSSSDTIDELVLLTDVCPTVLDYLGCTDGVPALDGSSLRPLVEGDADEWRARDAVMAEEAHAQRRRAIRTREWKYIRNLDDDLTCRYCDVVHAPAEELYHLGPDPGEEKSVLSDEPDRAAAMRHDMDRLVSEFSPVDSGDDDRGSYEDEDLVEDRLRALGYK